MKLRSVIFYVSDINNSKEFYAKIGFEVDKDFGNYVAFKTAVPAISFALNLADDETKIPGRQVCSIYIDEIEQEKERLENIGIEVQDFKTNPFGKSFHIRDVDGNKIVYVEDKRE